MCGKQQIRTVGNGEVGVEDAVANDDGSYWCHLPLHSPDVLLELCRNLNCHFKKIFT